MKKDILIIEVDDEKTAFALSTEAMSLQIKSAVTEDAGLFNVALEIAAPVQAYDFAMQTYGLMKRHAIDSRKRARTKQYDDFIAAHADFFTRYVAAYHKAKRYAAIDIDLRKEGMVVCADMKAAGMFSYATTNQDILSNFYRHIKAKTK